ncbi:MAG: response regulator transcription factor, partial [Bacteroidales bacterium]|nr:response regulator transcription factor [Bacteroidales bacterium]
NGKKAARQLIKDIPGIKIIMISGFISSENIRELLETGIMGIVSKTAGAEEILEAIYHVMNGKQHLIVESSINVPDEEVTPIAPVSELKQSGTGLLTKRELEVMRLIVNGYSSEMIIQYLAICQRTLHVHKSNIFKKCGLHSTAELLRYAFKNNLA